MRAIWRAALAVGLFGLATAASAETLTVGAYPANPPWEVKQEDGSFAGFEIDQGEMAWHDLDAAQLRHFGGLEDRHRPQEFRNMPLARLAKPRRPGFRRPLRKMPKAVAGPVGTGKPHPFGAAERGIAGIGGIEPRVDRVGDFRIGQAPGEIFAQRFRMFRLPV